MRRVLQLVLAAWAGSLWTICTIAAPTLFSVLPDRSAAGQVAGRLFSIETYLSLAFGAMALWLLMRGVQQAVNRVDYVIVIVSASAPALSEFLIRPFMESARSAGHMQLFGLLHGGAALLFAVASVGALSLLWRLTPRD